MGRTSKDNTEIRMSYPAGLDDALLLAFPFARTPQQAFLAAASNALHERQEMWVDEYGVDDGEWWPVEDSDDLSDMGE